MVFYAYVGARTDVKPQTLSTTPNILALPQSGAG